MNDLLRKDILGHPMLFELSGPMVISKGTARELGQLPIDLAALWEEFGGGEMFESETVFKPTGDASVVVITNHALERGLAQGHFVFHEGLCLSSWSCNTFYVFDSDSLTVLATHSTLDSWYKETIRSEYAKRYGISD